MENTVGVLNESTHSVAHSKVMFMSETELENGSRNKEKKIYINEVTNEHKVSILKCMFIS